MNSASFESISSVELASTSINESNSHQCAVVNEGAAKVFVNITINGKVLEFLVDTGATCTLICPSSYSVLGMPPCEPTSKVLKAYGGGMLDLKGIIHVNVQCGSIEKNYR